MKNKISLLDTNTIIRFLTDDKPEEAKKVEHLLRSSGSNSLHIPDVVIVEIVYVLLKGYSLGKDQVISNINSLVNVDSIRCNRSLIERALALYKENNISFVDAYLLAKYDSGSYGNLYTFDRKLTQVVSGAKAP